MPVPVHWAEQGAGQVLGLGITVIGALSHGVAEGVPCMLWERSYPLSAVSTFGAAGTGALGLPLEARQDNQHGIDQAAGPKGCMREVAAVGLDATGRC